MKILVSIFLVGESAVLGARDFQGRGCGGSEQGEVGYGVATADNSNGGSKFLGVSWLL